MIKNTSTQRPTLAMLYTLKSKPTQGFYVSRIIENSCRDVSRRYSWRSCTRKSKCQDHLHRRRQSSLAVRSVRGDQVSRRVERRRANVLDALLEVQVLHESALRGAVQVELTSNGLLTTALALINNVVQHLCSSSPSYLVGCSTVVEYPVEKGERQRQQDAGKRPRHCACLRIIVRGRISKTNLAQPDIMGRRSRLGDVG